MLLSFCYPGCPVLDPILVQTVPRVPSSLNYLQTSPHSCLLLLGSHWNLSVYWIIPIGIQICYDISHLKKKYYFISTYPSSSYLISLFLFIAKNPLRVVSILHLHVFPQKPTILPYQVCLSPPYHWDCSFKGILLHPVVRRPRLSQSIISIGHIWSLLPFFATRTFSVLFLTHWPSFLVFFAESSLSPNYSISKWPLTSWHFLLFIYTYFSVTFIYNLRVDHSQIHNSTPVLSNRTFYDGNNTLKSCVVPHGSHTPRVTTEHWYTGVIKEQNFTFI